jgi:hypothetical protein
MKEIERLRLLAESGDGPANLELGIAYWGDCAYGPLRKTPTDFALAVKYFQTAAEVGEDRAYLYLERAYKSGKGVGRNRKIAKQWRARYEQLDHVREYDHHAMRKNAKPLVLATMAAGAGLAYANYVHNTRIWWLCFGLALVTGLSAIINAGQLYWTEADTAKRDKVQGHDPSTTDAEGYRYYRSTGTMRRMRGFFVVVGAAAGLCISAYVDLGAVTVALSIAALLAGAYGAYTWWDAAMKLTLIKRNEDYRLRENELYSIRVAAGNSIPDQQPGTPTEYDTI